MNYPATTRRAAPPESTVVVTGMGVMSSVGNDPRTCWQQLCDGVSGVSRIEAFDVSMMPVRIAAEVKDFPIEEVLHPRERQQMDRFAQLGVVAGIAALRDATLEVGRDVAADRVGVVVGSGGGGLATVEQQALAFRDQGMKGVNPYYVPKMLLNMVSAHLAIRLGITGPSLAVATACATGANSVGEGYRMVRRGETDVAIVGASEGLYPLGVAGFCAARALSRRNDDPAGASRPFDLGRDGFVIGEGAAVLILEEYSHARARSAHIWAELAGYGTSTDAHHMTMPEPQGVGAAASIRRALLDAELTPADIDYVNVHATGTTVGDVSEARALETVFGADAPPCSATKSMTGHLLGASGALEAMIAAMSVATDTVPPTINLDNPDPACAANHIIGRAQSLPVRAALSNSFAFGGHNASLIFRKI
jgi:3-oxoacyl-[acyl-carrier-protein] synthase II